MPTRPTCPKCGKPAYRAYSQVQNPETKRSTSVAIPAVFCGEAGFSNGRGVLSVGKGSHGLVALSKGDFAAQMRQSHAYTARLKPSQRKGGVPSKKARPKAKPKTKPKTKRSRKAAPKAKNGAPAAPSE